MPYSDPQRKRANDRNYRLANIERKRQVDFLYRQKNKEKIKTGLAKWRLKNKEKTRKYREEHKQYFIDWWANISLDKKRLYRKNNSSRRALLQNNDPEKIRAWRRNYYYRNKEKIKENKKQKEFKRYHTDPVFRLKRLVRQRLRGALKGLAKKGSAVKLLGCTDKELKQYIEGKFIDGMNWSNYGPKGWHLDHKKPIAMFNLNDPRQLAEVCHYSNLQPLWWYTNIKKGIKLLD